MYATDRWTLQSALPILLSTFLALIYSLYILAYPPQYKKLSILLLALPVTYAFTHHLSLAPDWTVCDTFGRFLYIWYAHMSYEVMILQYTPTVGKVKEMGCKERVKAAYKVLFDRNHVPVAGEATNNVPGKHGYTSRWRFVAYHAMKAAILHLAITAWDTYLPLLSSSTTPSNLLWRLTTTFEWCIINLFLYELYHSLFAILFVGILLLDTPSEWSLSLCGPINEAWSVRRYWGKHWHNYIYHSFSAHVKVVTRGWLGLERGRGGTRLVENGLVFLASGIMHGFVRKVQNPEGEVWWIAVWYVAQMGPIVVEGVVQSLWSGWRKRMGVKGDDRRVTALEKVVGYAWVVGWFMWSVPKYIHKRDSWVEENIARMYAA